MLYTVRHMKYTVRFRLLKPDGQQTRNSQKIPLCLHIYKDNKEAPALVVAHVSHADWDHKAQKVRGRLHEDINNQIDQIRVSVKDIFKRQTDAGIEISASSLKLEFQHGKPYEELLLDETFARKYKKKRLVTGSVQMWTPADALKQYIACMQAEGKPKAHLQNYTQVEQKLEQFLTKYPDITLGNLTIRWGESFYAWLQSEGGLSLPSAYQYMTRLMKSIDHVIKTVDGDLKGNPLRTNNWEKGKSKDVFSLNAEAFERFWDLRHDEKKYDRWWWYALMMLTGFDYPDAVEYMQNRTKFEHDSPKGRLIIKNRKKTGVSSIIPIDRHVFSDKFEQLFAMPVPPVQPPHRIYYYGKSTITGRLGLEFRCTAKIARKTAGQIFFDKEKSSKFVSRLLGHNYVSTTERYYVRVKLDTVLGEL